MRPFLALATTPRHLHTLDEVEASLETRLVQDVPEVSTRESCLMAERKLIYHI